MYVCIYIYIYIYMQALCCDDVDDPGPAAQQMGLADAPFLAEVG